MATDNSTNSINLDFNNSVPSIAYKQILASAETAMYSPDELKNHIFSPMNFIDDFSGSYFRLNKSFGKATSDPLEISLPKSGIKYMHFWLAYASDLDEQLSVINGDFKFCGPAYVSIYASVINNKKITFTKDDNENYTANIPDGVKLVYGSGINFERSNYNRILKYHNYRGCITIPEYPIDISNNTGKVWIQIVFNNPKQNVSNTDVSTPDMLLIDEFVPVFYDHYGIAVNSWNNATFNALFGDIPFIKL